MFYYFIIFYFYWYAVVWLCMFSYTQLLNGSALSEEDEVTGVSDIDARFSSLLVHCMGIFLFSFLMPPPDYGYQFYWLFCNWGSDKQPADEDSEEKEESDKGERMAIEAKKNEATPVMDEDMDVDGDETIGSPKPKVFIVSMRACIYRM